VAGHPLAPGRLLGLLMEAGLTEQGAAGAGV